MNKSTLTWGKELTPLKCNLSHLLFKVEEAMMVLEDDSPMEAASSPTTPRNLLAWNITIPYIDFFDDDVKRERIPVFCIDVERNDRKAGEVKDPTCCHQRQEVVLLLRCLMFLHNMGKKLHA